MGLDSRFITTSDLEELFRDKSTGEPLAGGTVTFYSDSNRASKKPVYQLTGSPPNYSYAELPNPVTLSTKGTFQDDDGNNVVPYYYPYEGTPDDFTGTIDLYYVVVRNAGGTQQFVREGWPNFTASDTSADNEYVNFIPNGQFLFHNNTPITETVSGVDTTYIAQGGWAIKVTNGSTTVINTDNAFDRITTSIAGINDYPRYTFRYQATVAGNAVIRDLAIDFPDVNKFTAGDPLGSQDYTLFFAAESNDGNSYTFDVRRIYDYGSDSASPQDDVSIGSVTIDPGFSYYTVNITGFPAPSGTLGTLNDDYVSIVLRGPASTWDIDITDFALVQGSIALPFFPVDTNAHMQAESIAGWRATPPNPDGSDLYLPMVLTPRGMTFDDSDIGKIRASVSTDATAISTTTNELLCNGARYQTSAQSPLGIPYSRLQAKFWDSTNNMPIWGTGSEFATAYINSGATDEIILYTNQAGSQTAPANGASSPTFTYTALYAGATSVGFTGYANAAGIFTAVSTFTGTTLSNGVVASAGTSGMTFTLYGDANLSGARKAFSATALSAATLAAGGGNPAKYFVFRSNSTLYYMWFQLTTETDPAPGGTGIKVNMSSGMAAADIARLIANAMTRSQAYKITTVSAGTPIPAGSYFTFNANSQQYYVWYTIDGAGTEPSVIGAIGIACALLSTDTAAEVASKTQACINGAYFAVPAAQGVFLRAADPNGAWDLDRAARFSTAMTNAATAVGSFQIDTFSQHDHSGSYLDSQTAGLGAGGTTAYTTATGTQQPLVITANGETETKPVNMYVNWFVKY